MKKIVIFSDFDGTITERDVIVMIMEEFAPPEWVQIKDKILYERTITLKDGIEKLFGLIDSKNKNEIVDFVKSKVRIRSGFAELLNFCNTENIDFNVLSAGLDFFIEPVLKNYRDKLKVFCNMANFGLEKIKIDYKYLPVSCSICGNCGCCKVEIMEKFPKDKFIRIVMGDGLADLAPAKIADLVFARGGLIKYLEQGKISYIGFNDFHKVQEQLEKNITKRNVGAGFILPNKEKDN